MSFPIKLLIGIIALIAIGVLYYKWSYPTYSWHQKMTIIVETPTGVKIGSAVTSVRWQEQSFKMEGLGWHGGLFGEAVVVKLEDGRFLFGLLKGAGTTEYVGSVAAASISGQKGRVIGRKLFAEISSKRDRAAGIINVPDYQYPILVTFGDIDNPETIQLVHPNDLAANFGTGFALKSITLEITDEPVTKGVVEGVLVWMNNIRGRIKPYKNGPTRNLADVPEVELLDRFDFQKGPR